MCAGAAGQGAAGSWVLTFSLGARGGGVVAAGRLLGECLEKRGGLRQKSHAWRANRTSSWHGEKLPAVRGELRQALGSSGGGERRGVVAAVALLAAVGDWRSGCSPMAQSAPKPPAQLVLGTSCVLRGVCRLRWPLIKSH